MVKPRFSLSASSPSTVLLDLSPLHFPHAGVHGRSALLQEQPLPALQPALQLQAMRWSSSCGAGDSLDGTGWRVLSPLYHPHCVGSREFPSQSCTVRYTRRECWRALSDVGGRSARRRSSLVTSPATNCPSPPRTSCATSIEYNYKVTHAKSPMSVVLLADQPPTSDRARQHFLRVCLTVQDWLGNSLDPTQWGWYMGERTLHPVPSKLSPAPQELLHLIACNCKAGCRAGSGCSCRKAELPCTPACGKCSANSSVVQYCSK
ncbi:Telomerase reverse transcriptase [Frankliniella fusca]|uniref:Telomerase reverse transcriptase n=1 Tax=Frankliniella fusca TaxID=407009 RepID=A0AAE1LD78_9NEOP|nr:Telomerase reverse transcriptase [Frankliniella fusca]